MKQLPIPKVLECMYFAATNSAEHKRTVLNYEFDLYLDGKHKLRIDGVPYENTDRCLIFRKPGQFAQGTGDYNMFALTLDFSGSASNPQKLYRHTSGDLQPICDFKELDEIPPVFYPYHFEELKALLEKLSHCSYPGIVDENLQQLYIKEFLFLALYDAARHTRMQEERTDGINLYVKKACDYITRNFDQEITVKMIAEELYLNENYFIKIFKKALGKTPNQYILETRLIHARLLILQTDRSIQEIAFACGFNTPSYFAKRFYQYFQVLPNEMQLNCKRTSTKYSDIAIKS